MTSQLLIELAKWGVNIAFWPAFVFIPFVSLVWPWWRSFWGINIVTLEFAIMLALISAILSTDFGLHIVNNAVLAWTEVVALWLVGILVMWRGYLVFIAQMRGTRLQRRKSLDHENDNATTPS